MTIAKLCYLISLLLADNVYKEYMACFFMFSWLADYGLSIYTFLPLWSLLLFIPYCGV